MTTSPFPSLHMPRKLGPSGTGGPPAAACRPVGIARSDSRRFCGVAPGVRADDSGASNAGIVPGCMGARFGTPQEGGFPIPGMADRARHGRPPATVPPIGIARSERGNVVGPDDSDRSTVAVVAGGMGHRRDVMECCSVGAIRMDAIPILVATLGVSRGGRGQDHGGAWVDTRPSLFPGLYRMIRCGRRNQFQAERMDRGWA
jgi:hypothetical protein